MDPRRRFAIVSGLELLAAALLVLSLALPWYAFQVDGPYYPETTTASFYFSGVQTQSVGYFGETSSAVIGFGAYPLPQTGGLYEAVALLVVVAGLLAGGAVVLGHWGSSRRARRVATVAVVAACVFGVAAPATLALFQPTALCNDARSAGFGGPPQGGNRSSGGPDCQWGFNLGIGGWSGPYPNGPASGFVGHSGEGFGSSVWGPTLGWFLPFVATGLLVTALGVSAIPDRSPRSPLPE